MARKRKLDHIERDVIAAMKLGYGVHYGHYKADYPHTSDEEPLEMEIVPPERVRVCKQCGKLFVVSSSQHNKIYCDDYCRTAFNSAVYARRYQERKAARKGG